MLKINLNEKIFWLIASLIIISNAILSVYMYEQNQQLIQTRAIARGDSLKDYFLSMRYVYHQQFLKSGLDLNDSTLGFLPAHASTLISDRFSKYSKDGTTIRNVTDRPRNPKNKADEFEMEAIEYFKANPAKKMHMKVIKQNDKDYFNYTSPIVIDGYCIACHGKKENVIASIRDRYDTAYDYEVGDIRGVTSIKVLVNVLGDETMKVFYKTIFVTWFIILFLLIIIYFAIKKITIKDVEQKIMLQNEVRKKTADLEEQKNELKIANTNQQHLFSILRTIADCNQILITAKNIDELIQKTAISMHSNASFASVRILVFEDSELKVKSAIGLDEDFTVYELEEEVFKNNQIRFLRDFDDSLPKECLERVKKYSITAIYCIALRKDHYANALGIMTICSTQDGGFSQEERDMISELAGDVGFAINSFYQKDVINRLSFYDSLTSLPNQRLFEKQLQQALIASNKTLKYGAILLTDFDNFKSVNDLLGKGAGDSVLIEMGQRLVINLDKTSFISRFASDKFLVLLENLSSDKDEAAIICERVAQDILNIAKEPFLLDKQPFYLTSSVGITLFVDHSVTMSALLNQVEYAMRTAKNDGKNSRNSLMSHSKI